MIKPIKSHQSMASTAFKILWKMLVLLLQVVCLFASDRRSNSRYLPYQAQDLYKKGLINAAEYNRAIKSDLL
ncbi:hypothetical protein [Legionella gresilensis]|uniref:hypothetical protein n=1 Tax=Legionella gresilensis TaxID=91823 RepID=UPI0010412B01|nr:hypothetical protein [Legionella gresilensis]